MKPYNYRNTINIQVHSNINMMELTWTQRDSEMIHGPQTGDQRRNSAIPLDNTLLYIYHVKCLVII